MNPVDFGSAFTATIMNVVYGFELKNTHHRFVEVAEEAVRTAGEAAAPGAYLVDILPARESTHPAFALY